MNTTYAMIIGIAILVLVGGAYAVSQNREEGAMMSDEPAAMMEKDDAMMEKEDAMMEKDDAMMESEGAMLEKDDSMMGKDDSMMMQKGSYEPYADEKLALAAHGDVVLFFHANWCPICRSIESEINASASSIPDGVHILKVNYDTATALRQKYGVTVQHTFVQVDQNGNLIAKWSDASTLSAALGRVQ